MYWNIKCYLLNTSFKKFYLHAQSVVSTQICRVVRINIKLFKNQISAEITWCIWRYQNISVELFIFRKIKYHAQWLYYLNVGAASTSKKITLSLISKKTKLHISAIILNDHFGIYSANDISPIILPTIILQKLSN